MFENIKKIAQASMYLAESLPFEAYSSEEFYQLEMKSIFENEWIFVCHEQQIPNTGQFINLTIANEAVLIIRGEDGIVRALVMYVVIEEQS